METAIQSAAFAPQLALRHDFSPASRLWVYVANRPLSDAEAAAAQSALHDFAARWTSHNQSLQATAEVYQNQIILLMADETAASSTSAGGCSIDKSVHFLESLGQHLGVDLFDRMRFAWVEDNAIRFADRDTFSQLVREGKIEANTLTINTLVQTKQALQDSWLIPFGQSWLRRLV